jgi:hypothetical protein
MVDRTARAVNAKPRCQNAKCDAPAYTSARTGHERNVSRRRFFAFAIVGHAKRPPLTLSSATHDTPGALGRQRKHHLFDGA